MKKFAAILLCIVLMLALISCSSGKMAYTGEPGYANHTEETPPGDYDEKGIPTVDVALEERKLIRNAALSMLSSDFSATVADIDSALAEANGWKESEALSGKAEDYNRYLSVTFRIPADALDAFIAKLEATGYLVTRNVTAADVTDVYADIESRLSAVRSEEAALRTLLEQADSLDSIIKIQDRLTKVIYEIEKYESSLSSYDGKVAFSTVTLTLRERKYIEKSEVTGNVWERIGNGISDSAHAVGVFFEELFVALLANIIYIAILAVIVIAIVLIVKRSSRKAKQRREEYLRSLQDASQAQSQNNGPHNAGN